MTDTIAPTPERLAKHTDWETPQSDRKTKREHHRATSVIDRMCADGKISSEQKSSFEMFAKHLEAAECIHIPLFRYGRAFEGPDNSPWSSEDIRAASVFKVREANTAMGCPTVIRAITAAVLTTWNLERIGREIGMERTKAAAIGAANQLLRTGTYRLAVHYGFVRGP